MTRLILRRLASMVAVLLVLVAIELFLQHLSPVDPVRVLLGPQASASAQAEYAHRLGLDRPLPVQYARYLAGVSHGDFGTSVRTRTNVSSDLATAVPATVELVGFAILLAATLGLVLALTSAARWRGAGVLRSVLLAGASAPPFLLALLGILVLSNRFGWLPGTGRTSVRGAPTGPTGMLVFDSLLGGRVDVAWDATQHLFLPATCIALISAVAVGRVLRSSLIDSLGANYSRTAYSKGLTKRQVLLRHSFRNSVGPALSMAGLQLGVIFASDIVVEPIFGWPGMGSYLAQSIPANDFPAISAVTIILGAAYVMTNTAVDIAQVVADPRIQT
jgi:peptide/nickel transport system permease protein